MNESRQPAQGRRFATTRWSLVVAASQRRTKESRKALSELCEKYWYPLYSYVRRRGFDVAKAEDLTQGFFTTLIEKDRLAEVTPGPARGKFRSFLITSLHHYLADKWDKEHAKKRGGDRSRIFYFMPEGQAMKNLPPVLLIAAW